MNKEAYLLAVNQLTQFENTDFIICVCGYANDPKFWNCKKCKRPLQ